MQFTEGGMGGEYDRQYGETDSAYYQRKRQQTQQNAATNMAIMMIFFWIFVFSFRAMRKTHRFMTESFGYVKGTVIELSVMLTLVTFVGYQCNSGDFTARQELIRISKQEQTFKLKDKKGVYIILPDQNLAWNSGIKIKRIKGKKIGAI